MESFSPAGEILWILDEGHLQAKETTLGAAGGFWIPKDPKTHNPAQIGAVGAWWLFLGCVGDEHALRLNCSCLI